MPKPDTDTFENDVDESEVSSELDEAKNFAKTLSMDDVKSGQWFFLLLQRVIRAYDRNGNAAYFQQKYPGLPPDEIAETLTSVTVRHATLVGGLTGVAASAGQVATLSSAGMTATLLIGAIGAEMICLAYIQMRLVLNLAVVYDLQIDADDPEDMLMIFGYALGVAPTEMLGKGLSVAAGAGSRYAVRKYLSKGTLKAMQDVAQKVGVKLLQRTVIKYAVPVASAAVGSSYNYTTTKTLGKIAQVHLKNRGKVTEELRRLVSRQNLYDIAFPAAALYMAQLDGQLTAKEQELYRALLSRMSFEEHTQAEFQKIIASEQNILEAIARIEDPEVRPALLEVLVLMAIYDGALAPAERDFLIKTASQLNLPLDIDEVERRAEEYRLTVKQSLFQRTTGAAKAAASKTGTLAGSAAGNLKEGATSAGSRVAGRIGKMFRSKKRSPATADSDNTPVVCPNCEAEIAAEQDSCPSCGQSLVEEKACLSCAALISATFTFCPHCGSPQEG